MKTNLKFPVQVLHWARFFIIPALLVLLLGSTTYAELEVESTNEPHGGIAPQGTDVTVFSIKLTTLSTSETISDITIENGANTVTLGDGISKVSIYEDNGDNLFDIDDDTFATSQTFSSRHTDSFTFNSFTSSVTVTTENTTTLFFIYTIEDSADVGATTSFNITNIEATDTTVLDFGSNETSTDFTISGMSVIVSDIADSIVIPSTDYQPMLHIAIEVEEEDSSDFAFTISNESENFVTGSSSTDGVTAVHLYDNGGLEDFEIINFNEDNIIASVEAGEFTDASTVELRITESDGKTLSDGTTKNLFVLYDIGEGFSVTADTTVLARLTSVTANGDISNLEHEDTTSYPTAGNASSSVAGLSYGSLTSIATDDNYGQESTVPLLQFSLFAHQASIEVGTINIQNSGTVEFQTESDKTTKVTKIEIYLDNDRDDQFDGVASSDDLLIGSLILGNGNTTTEAEIPIEISSDGSTTGLEMSRYDSSESYTDNNEARLYVVYYIGTAFSDSSSTSTFSITADLADAEGTITIDTVETDITLSGTLPATDSDAEVNLVSTEVRIIEMTDASSTWVMPGQIKAPMLILDINASNAVSSASFTFINEGNTEFTSDSEGITKLWMYRDNSPTSDTLDGSVTLYSTTKTFTESTGGASQGTLDGISILNGSNRYFLLYDIGQNASSGTFEAQLDAYVDIDGSTFGGELPNPSDAASSTITSNALSTYLSVSDLTSSTTVVNSNTGTFNLTITLTPGSNANTFTVYKIQPRFYLSGYDGTDITYEFDYVRTDSNSTANMTSATTYEFDVSQANAISEGTIYIDAYVLFTDSEFDSNIELKRFDLDGVWEASFGGEVKFSASNTNTIYDWDISAYIESMQYTDLNNDTQTFNNGNILAASSELTIFFVDDGISIDESSLEIDLNGTTLSQSSSATSIGSTGYYYDEGQLIIGDIGTESGTITITVNDIDGNALDDTTITYVVSEDTALTDVLFYPNPYEVGSESLQIGFNLSQQADVTIYFVNYLGQLVKTVTYDSTDTIIGYNLLDLGDDEDYFRSGHYFVKVVAVGTDGVTIVKTTKLAIY